VVDPFAGRHAQRTRTATPSRALLPLMAQRDKRKDGNRKQAKLVIHSLSYALRSWGVALPDSIVAWLATRLSRPR
jgi:hypothetical protein